MKERLQKILAHAGVASRRKAEEYLVAGRVAVNGVVVTELGTKADPQVDQIAVDGKLVGREQTVVYILNKPADVVSTAQDAFNRKRVIDFVPKTPRVYPVGRLDRMTEGLIILTNDGDLALELTHPRYEHEKEYEVSGVSRQSIDRLVDRLRRGVELPDGFIKPDKVTFHGVRRNALVISLVVHEGRHHLIRRLCAKVGFDIVRLVRTRIGALSLHDLEPGEARQLTQTEISQLRASLPTDPDSQS